MKKKIILLLGLVISFFGMRAQEELFQPLPLNPEVKHGTLPNGLNYYILHNEEPKERANFYIAQKVGSSLENEDQLGLAHFLEHMAFNGSEHYPGKKMLEYLMAKGIRFGQDINAYTGFDETVYNINNVNTKDQALMDSVLLVLFDWSGSILLEESEIDAERGVIEGEYLSRNDASTRMFTAILPQIYDEYQYEQMPIGKLEIIKNFPPQALRDYYKKWYRPDLQGIIIVGDFDADEMEKKVVDLFSQIPTPENAAERIYPVISDNQEPKYVTFNDPEFPSTSVNVFFKYDKLPFEARNTIVGFMTERILNRMVEGMINNRLNEISKKPGCAYSDAGVSIGNFLISSQKGSFDVAITPKEDIVAAFGAAMGDVAQACKTGFMGTEVQRQRDEILAGYEKLYNERDKTKNEGLGRDLIRHFIDNTPNTGIELEYQIAQQLLSSLPESVYNEYASKLIHPDNQIILVLQPATPDLNVPAENAMFTAMGNALDAEYEPYVDEVITEPLIAKLPKAGKIKSEKTNAEFGTKEYILSNGVKVVVKPTDFSNDEIMLLAFAEGGQQSYPGNQAANVDGLEDLLDMVKVGPFTNTRLEKYLAGKKVSMSYGLDKEFNYFKGRSTKKDLNTMFELIYSAFTQISPDKESFDVAISRKKLELANQEKNPIFVFSSKMSETLYENNPFARPVTISVLDEMNYPMMLSLYKESVKNAADYTFVIVGNVDEATLKPMLTQYIASLPSKGKKNTVTVKTPFNVAQGQITEEFDIKSESPSVYIYTNINQKGLEYNNRNDIMIDFFGQILDNIFTATLREEMGATYSPQCWSSFSPFNKTYMINWFVITNADQQQAVRERALLEFNNLINNGSSAENFNKVKEAAIKQYENQVRTNPYWLSGLMYYENGINQISNYKETLESITLDDFNSFIKTFYNGKNRIEIVGDAK